MDKQHVSQEMADRLTMLENIIAMMPGYVYWKDKNGVYCVCSDEIAQDAGFDSGRDLIGKKDEDLSWSNEAYLLRKVDMEIMKSGIPQVIEELVTLRNGTEALFLSRKSPLYQHGEIAGLLGISIDITNRKKAEQLNLENVANKAQLAEQEKAAKIVDQVVHDIRSPIASMQMVLPLCGVLPENLRVTLKQSSTRILDIANNLLNQFKLKKENHFEGTPLAPSLISTELLEVLTEKKYEYNQMPINFISHVSQMGYFAFITIDSTAFKRALSNLINNAVDAFEEKKGEITLCLEVINNTVKITVADNGKGMPEAIKQKILNNVAVTDGKTDGHGIGFSQIRETLEKHNGILEIESELGKGTQIILTFPKVNTPHWIIDKIELASDDLIIILDDDPSIHGAWEIRFENATPHLARKHFEQGREAIKFINNLSSAEKEKVFLLTDYELLKQDLHGLDVIKQTQIKRSILVTSHHNNPKVRELATATGTQILPKPLASEVPIQISNKHNKTETSSFKKVDLIIIEDDESLGEGMVAYLEDVCRVVLYQSPHAFLKDLSQYSKDTRISLDNDFRISDLNGLQLARQLHDQGYTNLYMVSGKDFEENELPHYLTFILKTDPDLLKKLKPIKFVTKP
jgi:PAS domain S-box-containing protein